MAKSKEGMKEMLKKMEKYFKRKKLLLNIKKSKMKSQKRKVKNGLFQRRKRKKKEDGMELGRSENKRG